MYLLKKPLEEYIAHRFGASARLLEDRRFPRGSSRVTWFVDYQPGPGAQKQCLVFRGDFPSGSVISTSLEQEYFMYDRLGSTDVPVAKALLWEDDPEWVERPFYIREQIQGSYDVPNLFDPDPRFDELRIEISKEHLRKLALVHNVDWKRWRFDERLPAPKNEADCGRNFIDKIMGPYFDFALEPIPLVFEGIRWLKQRAPVAPKVCLCKGTNGFGEEIFRDGVIVAMSDWEEASIGDPASDFAALQSLVPEIERDGKKIWGMEEALKYYRSISGIDVTLESVQYYQTISRGLNVIVYSHRAAVAAHGPAPDIRKAWTGTEVLHFGKRMLAASMGLGAPVDAKWFEEMNESIA